MKIINGLLFSYCCIFLSFTEALAQGPYIKSGSIGSAAKPAPAHKVDLFPDLPIDQWVGKRFIFLPKRKRDQKHGYEGFSKVASNDRGLSYDDYVGKIVKVTNVSSENHLTFSIEPSGESISVNASGGSVDGIGPVSDIDNARKLYLGKTLCFRDVMLITYDDTQDNTSSGKVFGGKDITKYSPVKVIDIVAGWSIDSPVRFILKDAKGDVGFKDVHLSNTNVSGILTQLSKFQDVFLTTDPHVTYHWKPAIWRAIENGDIMIGMTEKQAEMSWGQPDNINTTTTGGGEDEQWVYPNRGYLYFKNGKLISKQEE